MASDDVLYNAICEFIEEHGYSPSYREMQDEVDCSLSTLHYRLQKLRAQGRITYIDRTPRTVRPSTSSG